MSFHDVKIFSFAGLKMGVMNCVAVLHLIGLKLFRLPVLVRALVLNIIDDPHYTGSYNHVHLYFNQMTKGEM